LGLLLMTTRPQLGGDPRPLIERDRERAMTASPLIPAVLFMLLSAPALADQSIAAIPEPFAIPVAPSNAAPNTQSNAPSAPHAKARPNAPDAKAPQLEAGHRSITLELNPVRPLLSLIGL
jgi:hypothetical protein